MEEEANLIDYFAEDYSLFIEAGFVAVKQLDEIAARRLFKAAEILNPDNPAAQLGIGYVALNKLQVSEAAATFESILKKRLKWHQSSTAKSSPRRKGRGRVIFWLFCQRVGGYDRTRFS